MNILIVDQEHLSTEVLVKCLKKRFPEIAVYAASDIGEAVRAMRQVLFDLVICDTSITLAGGLTLAALICHEQPETSIWLMTADTGISMTSLPVVPRPSCIKDVMQKPIDLTQLVTKVKEMMYPSPTTAKQERLQDEL